MAQYIDKSVVMAEINRVLNSYDPNEITSGRYALASLRDFLDAIEVKEVDFENEWEKYFEYRGDVATVNIKHLARHFFELGLKSLKERLL